MNDPVSVGVVLGDLKQVMNILERIKYPHVEYTGHDLAMAKEAIELMKKEASRAQAVLVDYVRDMEE